MMLKVKIMDDNGDVHGQLEV